MKIRHWLLLLLASLTPLIASAADTDLARFRFNGATDDTTRQSSQEIIDHLPNEKKSEYLAAIITIQQHDRKAKQATDPNAKAGPLGQKLDGKTYAEILSYAGTITDVHVAVVHTAGPPVNMQQGTLANPRLIHDAGVAIGKVLAAQGQHVESSQPARTSVMSQPLGVPGQRAWTELWVYFVDGQSLKFAIDFKESGDGADFSIRKL